MLSFAKVRELMHSQRAILGSLAAVDLARGVFNEVLWPFASLGGSTFFGALGSWVVIAAVLYGFIPDIYSRATGIPATKRGFRLLFGVFSLIFALFWNAITPGSDGGLALGFVEKAIGLILLTLLAGGTFTSYLRVREGWRLFDLDGQPVKFFEQFTPFIDARSELESDFQHEGVVGVFTYATWITAFSILLAFPCVFAGIVAVVVFMAYPLLDLLLLGWVVIGVTTVILPRSESRLGEIGVNVEKYLYSSLRNATKNSMGVVMVVFAVCGVAIAGFSLYLATGFAVNWVPSVISALNWIPGMVSYSISNIKFISFPVAIAGVVVCLLSVAIYEFWFWFREFQRISAFVDYWEGSATHTPVARPPGLTLPPAFVIIVVGAYLINIGVTWVETAFAVAWPILISGLIGSVWATRSSRIQRQSLDFENYIITMSIVIQIFKWWVVVNAVNVFTTDQISAGPFGILLFGMIIAACFSFLPTVYRYAFERDNEYISGVYLLACGVVVGLYSLIGSGSSVVAAQLVMSTCFVFGSSIIIVEWYGL